jgi:hypothetical protein
MKKNVKIIKTIVGIHKQVPLIAATFLGLVITSSISTPIIASETIRVTKFKIAWNNVYSLRDSLYDSYRKQLESIGLDDKTINERIGCLAKEVENDISAYKRTQTDPLKVYTIISDLGNQLGLKLVD